MNFVGGFCVRKILLNTICEQCRTFLNTPGEKTIFVQNREFEDCNLFCINDELMKFFKFVEQCIKPNLTVKNLKSKNFIDKLVVTSMSSFVSEGSTVCEMLKNHSNEDHRYILLKSLCYSFIHLRVCRFVKFYNEELKANAVRKRLTKTVHFKNQ